VSSGSFERENIKAGKRIPHGGKKINDEGREVRRTVGREGGCKPQKKGEKKGKLSSARLEMVSCSVGARETRAKEKKAEGLPQTLEHKRPLRGGG